MRMRTQEMEPIAPPIQHPRPIQVSKRRIEPHRGITILVLGILSLTTLVFLGPIAWSMGSTDLRKMRSGRMDKSGYSATHLGRTLGKISSLILVAAILCLPLLVWGFIEQQKQQRENLRQLEQSLETVERSASAELQRILDDDKEWAR